MNNHGYHDHLDVIRNYYKFSEIDNFGSKIHLGFSLIQLLNHKKRGKIMYGKQI